MMVDSSQRLRYLIRGNVSHKVDTSSSISYRNCRKVRKTWDTTLVKDGKSCILQFENDGKFCEHRLPPAGYCLVVRTSKTRLAIFSVEDIEFGDAQLFLEFQGSKESYIWERKLRKHLKVYSFPVTICPDQIFKEGDRILHVSKKFLAFSRYSRGHHGVIYHEGLERSKIELTLNTDNLGNLELRSPHGAVDRINFVSKDLQVIKDHINLFCNNSRRNSGLTDSTLEDIQTEMIGPITTREKSSFSSDSCFSDSTGSGYISIDDYVASDDMPYVEILPDNVPSGYSESSKCRWDPVSVTRNADTIMSQDRCNEKTLSSNSLSTQEDIEIMQGSNQSCHGAYHYQPLDRQTISEYTSLVKGPMVYNFVDAQNRSYMTEGSSRGRYINFDTMGVSARDDQLSSPNVCGYPVVRGDSGKAPPIPPRSRKVEFCNTKKVNLGLYLFGSQSVVCGMWTFAVLLTRCEDEDTFQRIKELENVCGNELLTSCRAIIASGDISVKVEGVPKEFEARSDLEQVISFGDIDCLSTFAWITLEFHFQCILTTADHFLAHLRVVPAKEMNNDGRNTSQLTSQRILVRKSFIKADEPFRSNGFRLPISLKDRIQFCQKMDLDDPIGKDWKWLAGELGLTHFDIQTIQHNKRESCTEQVLKVIERSKSDFCNLKTLRSIIEGMRRLDALENLSGESHAGIQ